MKRLVMKSVELNISVQEFIPENEGQYLQLAAHEASQRLQRIRERADKFRREEFEHLIAL